MCTVVRYANGEVRCGAYYSRDSPRGPCATAGGHLSRSNSIDNSVQVSRKFTLAAPAASDLAFSGRTPEVQIKEAVTSAVSGLAAQRAPPTHPGAGGTHDRGAAARRRPRRRPRQRPRAGNLAMSGTVILDHSLIIFHQCFSIQNRMRDVLHDSTHPWLGQPRRVPASGRARRRTGSA